MNDDYVSIEWDCVKKCPVEIRFTKYPELGMVIPFYIEYWFQTGMSIEYDKKQKEWVVKPGYDNKKIKYPDYDGLPPRCTFVMTHDTDKKSEGVKK